MVREYMKGAGYYSYDAASVDEDPVKHWIGREVKRFLSEAHVHVPFLLQLAAAPIELIPDSVQQFMNDANEEEMDLDDDAFAPTDAEIEREQNEEPTMMQHADMRDNYIAWVRAVQEPWDPDDTDEYRDKRALEYFNHSMQCSRDLLKLKKTLMSWVPHISCFVVPRQIRWLGDPASRAADACESFGALVKRTIKHRTCRRRVKGGKAGSSEGPVFGHEHTRGIKKWRQTFGRGYIEQAFRRVCVSESLLHGEADQPFLQRADWKLKDKGVKKEAAVNERPVPPTVRSLVANASAQE